jgi:hypothetical protein
VTQRVPPPIERRTLLMGSAGLMLLAACGGGSDGKKVVPAGKEDDGPVIVEQDAGNAVTPEDVATLVAALNAAFDARDLDALIELTALSGPTGDQDLRQRWAYRLENFTRNDIVAGEFFVGLPKGRARNASGGRLEYRGSVVFGHRIRDCDARDVVEEFNASFSKASADAPLVIDRLGDVEAGFSPAIWDVAKLDTIVTERTVLAFRTQDTALARTHAAAIDAGVKRAFALMAVPEGVSKVFFALAWDEVYGTLWGGPNLSESLGAAYPHVYLDPAALASGQSVPAVGDNLPVATARIALYASSFSSGKIDDVACHEAVHALANQWGRDSPSWVAEGLARWADREPGSGGLLKQRGAIAAAFPAFRRRMGTKKVEFYQDDPQGLNYECAGAVFEHLDRTEGRKRVFEVASAFYGPSDQVTSRLGVDEDGLLAATEKWLTA